MSYIKKGTKAFRRVNLAFFVGGFVTFANLYSTQPLMPVFSRVFRISPTVASLSLSATTAAVAAFMLVAGVLSEAFGRKQFMVAGMLGTSVLALLTAFSQNFAILVSLRVIEGVVLAGLPATAMAYLSEEVDKHSLGVAMGLYISGNSIGGMGGRIIIGTLTSLVSWRFAIGAIGVLSLVFSAIFVWALPPSAHFHAKPLNVRVMVAALMRHLRDPGLVYQYGIGFLLMGSFVTLFNYIGYLLTGAPYHLSQAVVGWIFVIYLTGTFSSTWMGRLADQYGRRRIMWMAIAIMLIGAVGTLIPDLLLKIVAVAVFTFGFFGGHSLASSWVGRRAISEKALASALYLFFYYIGSSIGGTAGGELWSSTGWVGVIGFIVAMLVLALACSLRMFSIPPLAETSGRLDDSV